MYSRRVVRAFLPCPCTRGDGSSDPRTHEAKVTENECTFLGMHNDHDRASPLLYKCPLQSQWRHQSPPCTIDNPQIYICQCLGQPMETK